MIVPTPGEDERSGPPVISVPDASQFVKGRRDFFRYRDLGVGKATGGGMSATVLAATDGLRETGWHYHECQAQFVYFLKGWAELEFEDGSVHRFEAGHSLFLPEKTRHNEIAASRDLELLEILIPAEMKTIACNQPNCTRA